MRCFTNTLDMATRRKMPRVPEQKLRVGDRVSCVTVTGLGEESGRRKGTVVYIHPKHRYYEVLFTCAGGQYREAYRWGCEE